MLVVAIEELIGGNEESWDNPNIFDNRGAARNRSTPENHFPRGERREGRRK